MADILDIVDLGTVQASVGAPDSGLGTLASYITTVSRHVDDLCGPVVQRTVTAEAHHGGLSSILLRYRPVVSVTTLTVSAVALTASDYHLDAEAGIVERLISTWPSPFLYGRWNVVVTYVAGRYPTTATVDPVFAQAAVMAVQGLWESQQGLGSATFGGVEALDVNGIVPGSTYVLPRAAYMLLRPYMQAKAGIA